MSLTASEYRIIQQIYEDRRMNSEKELSRRKAALYDRIPALAEIDEQLIHGSVQAAKLALEGNSASLDALSRTNEWLIGRKRQLLAGAGYPADYLERSYVCPICRDTGSVNGNACICFRREVIAQFYMDEGREERLQRENFSTFDPEMYSAQSIDRATGKTYREIALEALADAHTFVDNFGKVYRNLLLNGNTGVGKTFLTNCIAKELLDRGNTVLYLSAFRLFEIFSYYRFGDRERSQKASMDFDTILDCDLLIIDDLGTEIPSSYTTSQLFICLEERDLRHAPTLISTNLSMDELGKRYSDRIASRLFTFQYIKLFGKDIRVLRTL
ncbi:MAG: ATP-binding protein [Lachnospiraceae bacterium]|nr:ATP-binding protein [Lachnospiraceae bacterium]